jgi:hypothetical protein
MEENSNKRNELQNVCVHARQRTISSYQETEASQNTPSRTDEGAYLSAPSSFDVTLRLRSSSTRSGRQLGKYVLHRFVRDLLI